MGAYSFAFVQLLDGLLHALQARLQSRQLLLVFVGHGRLRRGLRGGGKPLLHACVLLVQPIAHFEGSSVSRLVRSPQREAHAASATIPHSHQETHRSTMASSTRCRPGNASVISASPAPSAGVDGGGCPNAASSTSIRASLSRGPQQQPHPTHLCE